MLVDATDLTSWAKRRDAQGMLPQIIRRLVHATVERVVRSGFRAGEGVQMPGWDGVVVVEEGNAFVPDATSAWELGTSTDVKGKADGDYEKRTAEPGNVDTAKSAFIFVTPKGWRDKESWVACHQAEGKWREVRAYDGDDLEEWLELAPAVHIWLSMQLGKYPEGTQDLGSFWEDWASVTQPAISPDLVLAGRTNVVEEIHAWLASEMGSLAIKAESRDEALATPTHLYDSFEGVEAKRESPVCPQYPGSSLRR